MRIPTHPMRTHSRTVAAWTALVFAGAMALVGTSAQAFEWFGSKTVAGSGSISIVKRELQPFQAITVSLHAKINVIQGEYEGVVVEADDKHLPLIETVVKGGQLRIRTAKGVNLPANAKVNITVHVRNIESLSLAGSADLTASSLKSSKLNSDISGSGSINIKDLQCDDLLVSIAGSGSFEAQGTAKAVEIDIAGAGDVSTAKLSAQDVKISIAGSGDATLWVRKSLNVSIAGAGSVRYFGEGILRDSSVTGSGRVRQLSAAPAI